MKKKRPALALAAGGKKSDGSMNSRLRQVMTKNGLTRAQTARMMRVDTSTVDRYLCPMLKNGKPNPTWRRAPLSRIVLLVHEIEASKRRS